LQGPTPSFVASTIWKKLSFGEIKNVYIQKIQEFEVFIPNYLCYATHVVKTHILWNNCNDFHEKAMLQKWRWNRETYLDYNSKGSPKKGNKVFGIIYDPWSIVNHFKYCDFKHEAQK
jgi:hypothetical protein